MSARLSRIIPSLVSGLTLWLLLAGGAAAATAANAPTTSKAATPTKKKITKKAKAKPKAAVPIATPAPATPPSEEPAAQVTAPSGSSAMAELKKSHARLQKLMGKKAPEWSPEATARGTEVRQIVGEFLDFQELSKRSLTAHWEGLPRDKRAAFVGTLRSLVERSYLDQMHGQADYVLKWGKETLGPSEATVLATLITKRKGKPIELALEYKMLHKERGWVVYDVVTDEQSLLETYRAEFTKIIRKESFDALLDRLKKKLDEKNKTAPK